MRRLPREQTCVVFDAQIENLAAIRCFVRSAAEATGYSRAAVDAMIQAVDEAATNIIVHGYRGRPGSIEVELSSSAHALAVRLRDDAPAFDPTTVPPPDLSVPLHLRPLGGLGVYLMREFVDRMSYRRTEADQNELTLEVFARERPGPCASERSAGSPDSASASED